MLNIKNLSKRFGGIKAVNDFSFAIPKKKVTAIIGPNGSGKTTVFNCINNIVNLDAGHIVFENKDITKKPTEYIANIGISRLFQHTQLCQNLSVLDNLLLGFDNEDTDFSQNIFSSNNDNERKNPIIEKYLSKIGLIKKLYTRIDELSYGQQRLVEFVRLLLKPTKLMLLDEPTAGVHTSLKKYMIEILQNLKKKGQTILFIEHDLHFVFNLADYVIVMDEGKIIASGSPMEIKNNPKVIDAYLGK